MSTVTLAEAETPLSALIDQAADGDPIVITRDGRPVAQITAAPPAAPRQPIDFEALRRMTDGMTRQIIPAGESMEQIVSATCRIRRSAGETPRPRHPHPAPLTTRPPAWCLPPTARERDRWT